MMSGLVGYVSSDEEEEVQERPAKVGTRPQPQN